MTTIPEMLAADGGGWLTTRLAEWLAAALDLSLKGSVVLLAAAAAAWLARRRSAAVRHALWSGAVAAVLALPFLQAALPAWRVPLLPAPRVTVPLEVRIASEATPAPAAPDAPAPAVAVGTAAAAAATPVTVETVRAEYESVGGEALALAALSRSQWAALIWAGGVLLVLLRIAVGTLGVWHISRRAAPVLEGEWLALAAALARRVGVTRPVTLLRSDRASVPVTWGVVYPVVLLPRETTGWAADRRAAVLLHELAHVRRFDALTQTVAQLALAVHWFNPLVWLAVRRMRAERERACDDAVLGAGTRASSYAEDLLDIVRSLRSEPGPAFAALAMARRSELEGRLLAILDPRTARGPLGGRAGPMVAALALLVALPLAAVRPVAAEARAPEASPVLASMDAAPAAPVAAVLAETALAAPEPARARPAPSSAALPCRMQSLIGDDEPYSSSRAEHMWFHGEDDRCFGATFRGRVELTDARDDVRSLAPNGFLVIVEQRGVERQRVEFVRAGGGDVRRFYYEGSRRAALGADARRWVGRVVSEVARAKGFPPGVIYTEATAPDVASAASEPAPGTAGAAAGPPVVSRMSREDLRETLILAAKSATGLTSDSEKARLLSEIAQRYVRDDTLRAAYLRAARSIVSDGSKRMALEALVQRDTMGVTGIVAVVRAAREIVSEGDRSRLLRALAARYAMSDPDARRAYFTAAGEIVTESERRAVLLAALPVGASREVAINVLRASESMVSGKERGDVLLAVVERASLADAAVRQAFFKSLEGMSSDADYRRVMAAVMR